MALKQTICRRCLCVLFLLALLRACPSACYLLAPARNLYYHHGPILASDGPIKLRLTFYGDFTSLEKDAIRAFLNSLPGHSVSPQIVKFPLSARHSLLTLPPQGGIRLGRKETIPSLKLTASGFPSLKQTASGPSFSEQKPTGFAPFELKSSAPSSVFMGASLVEDGSAISDSDASFSAFSESSSSEEKPSGSSSDEQQARGFPAFDQKGSGPSSSVEKFSSSSSSSEQKGSKPFPTVADWWSLTRAYPDSHGRRVPQAVLVEQEDADNYSLGTRLSRADIALLARRSAGSSASNSLRIHVILTAADVGVEGFCMHACGTQGQTQRGGEAYVWVGSAREQCPGYCSWPFARAGYGPDMDALKAPNGASQDGMIINLAKLLAEAAINPHGDGYHAGLRPHDGGVGIAGLCAGVYGEGAYPGYPGHTYTDQVSGASFNVMGSNKSKFLLPSLWNSASLSCAVHP